MLPCSRIMTPRSIRRAAERKAAKLARKAEINRQNSLHSTGPVSVAGKLASSRNSLKHGLASATLIIPGEDPAAFEALKTALIEEHQPATETEELLVNEMAQSYWLEQRALRLQNDCFTENGIDEKRLSLFLRYQTTHHRAFHKALTALLKLHQTRARGFVSQETCSGADSQSARDSQSRLSSSSAGFVPQNSPSPVPESGFVSQKSDPVASSAAQFTAEAA